LHSKKLSDQRNQKDKRMKTNLTTTMVLSLQNRPNKTKKKKNSTGKTNKWGGGGTVKAGKKRSNNLTCPPAGTGVTSFPKQPKKIIANMSGLSGLAGGEGQKETSSFRMACGRIKKNAEDVSTGGVELRRGRPAGEKVVVPGRKATSREVTALWRRTSRLGGGKGRKRTQGDGCEKRVCASKQGRSIKKLSPGES